MNLQEYRERMKEDQKWLPGLDAINEALNKVYKDVECTQYGSIIYDKDEIKDYSLYGFSIYESKNGYKHLISHGMSEIYADEDHFGKKNSGFGYEMTIKINEENEEECKWAIEMLVDLSIYAYKNQSPLKSMQYIKRDDSVFYKGNNFNIDGIMIINDTEIDGIDTVHGRVEFLQIVGITKDEIEHIERNSQNADNIIKNMRKSNPYLVLDKYRKESYN